MAHFHIQTSLLEMQVQLQRPGLSQNRLSQKLDRTFCKGRTEDAELKAGLGRSDRDVWSIGCWASWDAWKMLARLDAGCTRFCAVPVCSGTWFLEISFIAFLISIYADKYSWRQSFTCPWPEVNGMRETIWIFKYEQGTCQCSNHTCVWINLRYSETTLTKGVLSCSLIFYHFFEIIIQHCMLFSTFFLFASNNCFAFPFLFPMLQECNSFSGAIGSRLNSWCACYVMIICPAFSKFPETLCDYSFWF